MRVYQINYNLRNPTHRKELYACINDCGYWCRPFDSTWILASANTARQIHNHLAKILDPEDAIMVTRLDGEAAWQKLGGDVTTWLQQLRQQL